MSKNNLSTIRRQPYEVIETLEETITRYYDPTSFDAKILSTNRIQLLPNKKLPEETDGSEDNSNAKIALKNIQLQDLYERFKKLRSVMSEITERFREINMNPQNDTSVLASTNVADIQNRYLDDGNIPDISELEDDEEQHTCITTFSQDFNIDADAQRMESQTRPTSPKFLNALSVEDNERNERYDDHSLVPNKDHSSRRTDVPLLEKSKKLLINLIDKEIQKADKGKSVDHTHMTRSKNCVRCKIGCIQNICKELDVLKDLENFDG